MGTVSEQISGSRWLRQRALTPDKGSHALAMRGVVARELRCIDIGNGARGHFLFAPAHASHHLDCPRVLPVTDHLGGSLDPAIERRRVFAASQIQVGVTDDPLAPLTCGLLGMRDADERTHQCNSQQDELGFHGVIVRAPPGPQIGRLPYLLPRAPLHPCARGPERG
jgi:hypothetical protein